MAEDIDSLKINGKTMASELRSVLQAAEITRAFDSSPTLTLTVHDEKRTLMRSGIFRERATAQFFDFAFELAQTKKTGSQLTIVMEDLAVAELRRHTEPYTITKGSMTRIQFVRDILQRETPWIGLHVDSSVNEPVAQVQLARGTVEDTASAVDPAYGPAPTASPTPAAGKNALSAAQIAGAAKAAGFTGNNLVIAVAVAFAESGGRPSATNKNTNGSTDFGLWQINSVHAKILAAGTWSDPLSNAKMAYSVSGGKNWTPWVTYKNGAYKKFLAQAQSAAGAPSSDYSTAGAATADAGSLEDSWTCFKRIFAEVNWRIYADRGQLYAGPDSAFINKDPIVTLREFSGGVNNIDYDIDTGKPVASIKIEARMNYWAAQPGSVMETPDLGTATTKWLCSSITRDIFKTKTTIDGTAPRPEFAEPPDDVTGDDYGPSATENGLGGDAASGGASDGKYIWPVSARTLSAPFGEDRPGHKHSGIDISVGVGATVVACRDGSVIQAGNSDPGGYGNTVLINHEGGDQTLYAHLSAFLVRGGMTVKQGEPIGKSGGQRGAPGAGNSQGPHLHFEIRQGGKAVNPIPRLTNAAKIPVIAATNNTVIELQDGDRKIIVTNNIPNIDGRRGGASGSW